MAQLIHTSPNFIVNAVKGWNTRLLYTYYAHYDSGSYQVNFADIDMGKNNLFTYIQTRAASSNIVTTKGQYTYPQDSYFFKTGKSIRVKGHVIASTPTTNAVFNMCAGIDNATDATVFRISSTNNGNDHIFAGGNVATSVPVSFEIVYSCLEDETEMLYFQASGFYEYDIESFNVGGTNISHVYVPIWKSAQFTAVGTSDDEYRIYIDCENSANMQDVIIRHITIEELS